MIKICTVCKVPKEFNDENFRPGKSRNGRVYYRKSCRECEIFQHLDWQKKNIRYIMFDSAKHRAKRDGVPFAITQDDITIPKRCPVFGTELKAGDRRNHANAPSLDRFKPELGYVPGNICVISHRANLTKNNATLDELRKLVAYLEHV